MKEVVQSYLSLEDIHPGCGTHIASENSKISFSSFHLNGSLCHHLFQMSGNVPVLHLVVDMSHKLLDCFAGIECVCGYLDISRQSENITWNWSTKVRMHRGLISPPSCRWREKQIAQKTTVLSEWKCSESTLLHLIALKSPAISQISVNTGNRALLRYKALFPS